MAYSSSGASQIKYVVLLLCDLMLISGLTGEISDNSPQIKYDVFVSFRGEDIRHGFLGYLTEAFHQKQIHAFIDDKLEKGDEIWPSLVGAIQGSLISLTIFSGNYSSSRWCLEELVKIIECRETYGQTVIPVFYHVNPTDVRHQKGSYEKALAEHEKKYNLTTVQNWRHALKKAADLSGIKSFDYKNEVELLGEIINTVNLKLMRLDKNPLSLKGLVGIDRSIQYVESMLQHESSNVRVIGIWGMGGIGKTTIAQEILNKLCSGYDSYCVFVNVKEEIRRHGIITLKEIFFSTLLQENVKMITANGLPNYIKKKIGGMKVLIVLDDVNDSDLLEKLFGNHDWFGPGSRIILTTRDKQVLIANKVHVDDIYQVGVLNPSEALELFILHAFNQKLFDMEYYKLSKRVVCYAQGIPLVLKVLGGLLCGKDKEVWESQLDKLKNMPNTDVYNAMRLSYDDLDRKEQKIFLDLACFFIGLDVKVDLIKVLLKDNERDNSVVVGLERLKDKSLITISKYNIVYMHDIIQEMGWEIVRQESIEDPGSRSRLWDADDIYEVLKNNKGTESIRSIRADLSVIRELKLSPDTFTKMSKLQFLHFPHQGCVDYFPHQSSVDHFPHRLQSFSVELRYIVWRHFPLKSLPENFSAKNLVLLDLSYSRVEKLWDGIQNLKNLKEVKVSGSKNLKELPNLSEATNLEVLDISACPQLASVIPSIFSLTKLKIMKLNYRSFTQMIIDNHTSSISFFTLQGSTKHKLISLRSENITVGPFGCICYKEKPSSFVCQSKLEMFRITESDMGYLPSSFMNLRRQRYLRVLDPRELLMIESGSVDVIDCKSLKHVLVLAEQFKYISSGVGIQNYQGLVEESVVVALDAISSTVETVVDHSELIDDKRYISIDERKLKPVKRIDEYLMKEACTRPLSCN
ncbi:disease resistance protein RPP5-like isoform X3 [Glycine soja]|uniref:disease resistance protein RPP5-like isoform X3 n=1 Tax=Glycine soja TaxID=3848 RepID=UPI00103C8A93|nr:disease resistance protein RPP5-like isoform X3 [Glycine soja]